MIKNLTYATLFGLLITSCGGNEEKSSNDVKADVTPSELSIAYYIEDSIPSNFTYFVELDGQIEARAKVYQNKLAVLQQEGQQLLDTYQRKMAAGLLSQNDQMSYEKRIQEKQYQIQVLQETDGVELERDSFNGNEELHEKMKTYGEEYAKSKGYTLLVGVQQGGQILYIDPSMDVTMDFIDFMNQQEDNIEE